MSTSYDQYPVGLLHDIRLRRLRYGLRYVRRQARARNWRAIRNYFRNGWLTEHAPPCRHNAGHGWTRTRSAIRADHECKTAALATAANLWKTGRS